jgi:hypothetical protein
MMIKTVDEVLDYVAKFLDKKGYIYIGDSDSDMEYTRFYFKNGNNPLELTLSITSEFENDEDMEGTPKSISFYTVSSYSDLSDYVFDNGDHTPEIQLDSPTFDKDLEKMFKSYETNKVDELAPGLCEWIMKEFDYPALEGAYLTRNNDLETLFAYCDMMEEYVDWVTPMGVPEMMPQAARDMFLF